MPKHPTLATLRRSLIAVGVLACSLSYATPAAAGPLCTDVTANDITETADTAFDLNGDGSVCRNFFVGGNNAAFYYFDLGTTFDNLLRVTVDTVLADFGLTFTRDFLAAGTTFGPMFPNYTCVAYGVAGQCVEYTTSLPPIDGVEYSGQITWLIAWNQPIGTSPIPDILHDTSNDADDLYDELLQGVFFDPTLGPANFACDSPYYQSCPVIGFSSFAKVGDPVRAAVSDNFSKVVVAQQNVPEPGTLALLGLGFSGLVLNRKRRSKKKD
jgi:hypothetical protein